MAEIDVGITMLFQLTDYELCIAANLVDPLSMTVSWEDIGGLEETIEQIQDTVIFPFRRRDLFPRSNLVQPPKGRQNRLVFVPPKGAYCF